MHIRPASLRDIDAYVQHFVAHVRDSGRDGAVHYAMSRRVAADDIREATLARWMRRLDEPLWSRTWLLCATATTVVGHLELRGGRFPAEFHRATLGMGLQREHTAKGWGGKLIVAAVGWARDEAKLAWIDLGVFAHNAPARKLYERMGFIEVGRQPDRYRIDDGVVVEDIQMTLAL